MLARCHYRVHQETLSVQQKIQQMSKNPIGQVLFPLAWRSPKVQQISNKYPKGEISLSVAPKKTLMFNKYPTNTLNAGFHYQVHQGNPKSTTNVKKISNNRAPPPKHLNIFSKFTKSLRKIEPKSLKKLLNFSRKV